jgi:hypothetical protein
MSIYEESVSVIFKSVSCLYYGTREMLVISTCSAHNQPFSACPSRIVTIEQHCAALVTCKGGVTQFRLTHSLSDLKTLQTQS